MSPAPAREGQITPTTKKPSNHDEPVSKPCQAKIVFMLKKKKKNFKQIIETNDFLGLFV